MEINFSNYEYGNLQITQIMKILKKLSNSRTENIFAWKESRMNIFT